MTHAQKLRLALEDVMRDEQVGLNFQGQPIKRVVDRLGLAVTEWLRQWAEASAKADGCDPETCEHK